ncbi:MAG: MCE family protein [Actinophytocola sp.]|nr:MCE family protein [Actinophytocola sp.]
MKPLKERNQAAVGAVTVLVLVLSVLSALNANNLPLIGGGASYGAYFAESAGLQPGNEVQLAGVRIGEVQDVELAGKQVLVTFRIDRQGKTAASYLGDATGASIEIKTLLGEKYLALLPAGKGTLDPNQPMPLSRTRTPFQLQDAFNQLSDTVSDVDTGRLAKSFEVIAETFADTPEDLSEALRGLSSLSKTVASRDEELGALLGNTSKVSKLISGRNKQLDKVINDGNRLLAELQGRKAAIHQLLAGTKAVSEQLSGLVADNKEQLRPALRKLDNVTGVLRRNADNLDRSLELLAPFTRIGANATGNGRWFEGYLCGFMPPTMTAAGMTINPQGCESPVSAPNQGVGGN